LSVSSFVVREGSWLDGVDSASLWALVADPRRIGEWTPLQFVGYMGKELPEVGNAFFAGLPRTSPRQSLRFEFTTWEAGRRYRCSVSGGRLLRGVAVATSVIGEVSEGAVTTRLDLEFGADLPAVLRPIATAWASRLLRKAIDRAESGSR
jgi:hypothetical protein